MRKNKLQEITPIHKELEEPLERGPRGHLRPDRLPGAGAEGRPDHRGYSLGEADILRRVMGKKKPENWRRFTIFQAGARKIGYSDEAIQALWDVLVPFAGYAFNKAHSAAYGLVSYWTPTSRRTTGGTWPRCSPR
ncbi:hypothetical protein GCM10023238_12430 [Streptomyces heliomycini]